MGALNCWWLWSCTNAILQKIFAKDTAGLSPPGGFYFYVIV